MKSPAARTDQPHTQEAAQDKLAGGGKGNSAEKGLEVPADKEGTTHQQHALVI